MIILPKTMLVFLDMLELMELSEMSSWKADQYQENILSVVWLDITLVEGQLITAIILVP